MKMSFTKHRRHKASKTVSPENPLNALTISQLYEVWSSSIAADDTHNADAIEQRIRHFVEEEGLNTNPVHLMRALIHFTMACNDYAFHCIGK